MTTASKECARADTEAARALKIVESMPGHAWSADAAGQFTYVSPSTLAFLGEARESLNSPQGKDEFGWRSVVHPDDHDRVVAKWRHCLRTGDHYDTEYRLRRADGVYRWFRNSGRPSRDNQGNVTGWYGTTIDIEEQKQVEAVLRDRERELLQLVDMVPSHLWRLTLDGEPIFFNKRMVDFIGLDLAATDKPGMSRLEAVITTVIHPGDAAAFRGVLNRCLATGESFAMRYRLRRADGVYRWMSSRAEPMRDQNGRIVQWYGLCHDIDDQMRAEEALCERERELSQFVNMVPSLLWRLTPDGEPTFFNKRTIDFLGRDVPDYEKPGTSRLVATIEAITHPDDAADLTEALNHSFVTGESFSMRYRLRRADGVYRWMSGHAEPMRDEGGRIIQWYGLARDIDDQVRVEEALRRSEQQLQQTIDAVPVRIWSAKPTGGPIYFNKRYQDYLRSVIANFDALQEQRIETFVQELIHPEDAPEVLRSLGNCFETGNASVLRFRWREKDGAYRWAECRVEPRRDQDGAIVQWYGASIDIDDEVRAQEALRRSERELSQLVDMVPVHIRRLTVEGEATFFNKRMIDFLGLDLAELRKLGASRAAADIQTFVHPDDAPSLLETVRRSLATGEGWATKYRMRRADGVYRWLEGRAEPMRDQDGAIVQWYAVTIDIDDYMRAQQAEEALRQASAKLAQATQAASLAELSASIAHEVNQPLAAIVFNSHACHRWLSAEPPNVERAKITIERIVRDANAAADVVSRIRALFRQSVEPRNPAALPSVIAEARNLMAEEAARRRVRMDVDVESNLPLVAFDRVQVQQVLINLIRNGMDAMDSTTGDRVLGMRVRRMGDVVQIEIRDRGRGIEFPNKIFEPFFTTKENGMGMGLTICRSIVESHGGRLWVEKNEPEGAAFIFKLPIEMKAAP
jgi:PAS domain S-box-containing protein